MYGAQAARASDATTSFVRDGFQRDNAMRRRDKERARVGAARKKKSAQKNRPTYARVHVRLSRTKEGEGEEDRDRRDGEPTV